MVLLFVTRPNNVAETSDHYVVSVSVGAALLNSLIGIPVEDKVIARSSVYSTNSRMSSDTSGTEYSRNSRVISENIDGGGQVRKIVIFVVSFNRFSIVIYIQSAQLS